MSSIDELRSRFYDDDQDTLGLGLGSSSTLASGSAAESNPISTSGPPRASSATADNNSLRAAPYPKARGGGRMSARIGSAAAAKSGETAFMARARAAPDDDDPFGGYGLRNANDYDARNGRGDGDADGSAMDVDGVQPAAAVDPLRARAEREARENDVQRLVRAWQDERHAPDILPARDVLLGRVLDAIRRQTNDANALRTAETLSEEDHYMTMLVQTEVERIKFIVRSYVRTRLFKIEQYAAYITSDRDAQTRLTEAELQHAQRYAKLVVSQFCTTVLNHLPEAQQALDDDVITIPSMITEPDKDRPVFFHAFEAIEHLTLSDGSTMDVPRDAIYLVPYRVIEQHLLRGEVELI